MFNNRQTSRLLASPYIAWAVIFIVVPLAMIFFYGLTDESGALTFANVAAIARPENLKSLGLALVLALISTIICFLLAYPLAMILASKLTGNHNNPFHSAYVDELPFKNHGMDDSFGK